MKVFESWCLGLAIRYVCKVGEEILRKKSKEVKKVDQKIIRILEDMADTLQEADGLGLAAPQVGILKRLVVINVGDGLIELINPVITEQEGNQLFMEGCLSYPGFYGRVERPINVTVRSLDRKGAEVEYKADGVMAVAVCHEIDHLNGVMFLDKVQGELYTAEQVKEMEERELAEREKTEQEREGQERAESRSGEQQPDESRLEAHPEP